MSIRKIRYSYRSYEGCPEATEKSRKWETFKAGGRATIWIIVASGLMLGVISCLQIISNEEIVPNPIPYALFSLFSYFVGYLYIYLSNDVYPECEVLFLRSKQTPDNFESIEKAIKKIREDKRKRIRKAFTRYTLIYLACFALFLVCFFAVNQIAPPFGGTFIFNVIFIL